MYTINFCHKNKEQWQKIAKMLQNVNKFCDAENIFKNYVFEKIGLLSKFY